MSEARAPIKPSDLVIYRSPKGAVKVGVLVRDETLWLTQRALSELFAVGVPAIAKHLKNIFQSGELSEKAVVSILETTGSDGKTYRTQWYQLDAVIAVGYRVNTYEATQFRIWATAVLREYIVKGFALDDERLKRTSGLADYFDELLARIREIRASEGRVYQRVRDLFALAVDYRDSDREAQLFFARVQNKMHYAATGLTAAEIVRRRADAARPNMGLTSWSGDRVAKRDVATAKNYLDASEIDTLNRIVVMFLDRAEFRAQRRKDLRMADWDADLDKFLADTELPVLASAGNVSHELATRWAGEQYEAFAERRRLEAEGAAEGRYLDDLVAAAQLLDEAAPAHAKTPSKSPRPRKKP